MTQRRAVPADVGPLADPATSQAGGALSARQAAALLGVHERTISRAIRDGRLVAAKNGRTYVITPDALHSYRVSLGDPRRIAAVPTRPKLTLLRKPGWDTAEPVARMPNTFPAGTIPQNLTSFVGRDREVATLLELLRQPGSHLVTVIGPGGVGKTRLAIAAAREIAAEFTDGVAFIPLAAATDPGLVVSAIAHALDIREATDRPLLDGIVAALRDRRPLLVLDNFEHVLAAAVDIAFLLGSCPGLKILATSRAPLRVSGERRFLTPPLSLPLPDETPTDRTLADHGATALFVERAGAARRGFMIDAETATAIVEICRRLDGLPLAIELAAAWTPVLAPMALLGQLEQRLPLLHGGNADQPARLRTMHDAIAWSYDLLTVDEARFFRRLGAFAGGFTLEAADWVGSRGSGVGGTAAPNSSDFRLPTSDSVLDLLAALIEKSLLQPANVQGLEPRFVMLETVREFAAERLAESAESATIRDRHAAWCLAFAEPVEQELMGPNQAAWFDRLEAEHANLQAALSWFHAQGDGERGLRLASALTWFWYSRSYFREAGRWLETFLAMPMSTLMRGRGLVDAANIRHWQGDIERAIVYAEESLAICQAHDDHLFVMYALRRLASLAIDRQDLDRAAALLAESEALAPSVGNAWDAAFAIYLSGRLAAAAGNDDEAIARFAAAAGAFGAINDRGYIAAARGQQGAALLRIDDLPAAAAAYAESLELASRTRDQTWIAWAMAGAAHIAHARGEAATAARLLGAAAAIREAIGEARLPTSALDREVKVALGEARFGEEWDHGSRSSETDVIAEARAILGGDGLQPLAQDGQDRARDSKLTTRERDVLRLLVAGQADKEIAAALAISRATVSRYVASIRAKLDAPSRGAAIAIAVRDHLT